MKNSIPIFFLYWCRRLSSSPTPIPIYSHTTRSVADHDMMDCAGEHSFLLVEIPKIGRLEPIHSSHHDHHYDHHHNHSIEQLLSSDYSAGSDENDVSENGSDDDDDVDNADGSDNEKKASEDSVENDTVTTPVLSMTTKSICRWTTPDADVQRKSRIVGPPSPSTDATSVTESESSQVTKECTQVETTTLHTDLRRSSRKRRVLEYEGSALTTSSRNNNNGKERARETTRNNDDDNNEAVLSNSPRHRVDIKKITPKRARRTTTPLSSPDATTTLSSERRLLAREDRSSTSLLTVDLASIPSWFVRPSSERDWRCKYSFFFTETANWFSVIASCVHPRHFTRTELDTVLLAMVLAPEVSHGSWQSFVLEYGPCMMKPTTLQHNGWTTERLTQTWNSFLSYCTSSHSSAEFSWIPHPFIMHYEIVNTFLNVPASIIRPASRTAPTECDLMDHIIHIHRLRHKSSLQLQLQHSNKLKSIQITRQRSSHNNNRNNAMVSSPSALPSPLHSTISSTTTLAEIHSTEPFSQQCMRFKDIALRIADATSVSFHRDHHHPTITNTLSWEQLCVVYRGMALCAKQPAFAESCWDRISVALGMSGAVAVAASEPPTNYFHPHYCHENIADMGELVVEGTIAHSSTSTAPSVSAPFGSRVFLSVIETHAQIALSLVSEFEISTAEQLTVAFDRFIRFMVFDASGMETRRSFPSDAPVPWDVYDIGPVDLGHGPPVTHAELDRALVMIRLLSRAGMWTDAHMHRILGTRSPNTAINILTAFLETMAARVIQAFMF